MDIIRKELAVSDLLPAFIRWNDDTDTVQTSPDGGVTWVDSPQSDPRNTNSFPPLTGGTARCDAAERMTAQIQEMVTVIDNNLQALAGAAEMAALLILIMAFIPLVLVLVAILTAAMVQFVAIGYADFHNAFTGFDWTAFKCKLYTLCDTQGRLNATTLSILQTWISQTYGSPLDTILNALISVLGFGGLNDAAATRSENGSCGSCSNAFDITEEFGAVPLLNYILGGDGIHSQLAHLNNTIVTTAGCNDPESKMVNYVQSGSYRIVQVTFDFGRDVHLTAVDVGVFANNATHAGGLWLQKDNGALTRYVPWATAISGGTGCIQWQALSGGYDARYVSVILGLQTSTLNIEMPWVRMIGSYL